MSGPDQYFVTRASRCWECDGSGVVYSALWELFHAQVTTPRGDDEAAWREWSRREAEWWARHGFTGKHRPAEESECSNCEGIGVVRDEIDLTEALQALGVQVPAEGGC